MSIVSIIAALIGLAFAAGLAMHGPALLAQGIAKLVWTMGNARADRLVAALAAPRAQRDDRWAQTSKEDCKLLSATFAIAMDRTEMRSLLPSAI